MAEDKIKEDFKNFEAESSEEDDEEPQDKLHPITEFLMTYGWAVLAVITAIGVLAYFGVFSSPAEPYVNDTEIIPGNAYVDFSKLDCDRFLAANNFSYLNRSSVEYISHVIDHVLCVTRDVHEKNPGIVEESMKKYNIGLRNT